MPSLSLLNGDSVPVRRIDVFVRRDCCCTSQFAANSSNTDDGDRSTSNDCTRAHAEKRRHIVDIRFREEHKPIRFYMLVYLAVDFVSKHRPVVARLLALNRRARRRRAHKLRATQEFKTTSASKFAVADDACATRTKRTGGDAGLGALAARFDDARDIK